MTILTIAFLIESISASSLLFAQRSANLDKKLQRQVTVTWQNQQLAAAVDRLASTGQLTVWLDRRVDKQKLVNLQLTQVSLLQALRQLAEQHALQVATVEEVLYVGPKQSTLELPVLIKHARSQVRRVPKSRRQRWLKKEAVQWQQLSEPRALVGDWLQSANIKLDGAEQIPHDLYSGRTLPPLALVDRLVLLLAEFDLTCQIARDGKSCRVVPIQRPLKVDRETAIAKTLKQGRPSRRGLLASGLHTANQKSAAGSCVGPICSAAAGAGRLEGPIGRRY